MGLDGSWGIQDADVHPILAIYLHIFPGSYGSSPIVIGGIWSVWGRFWMDLMVFGGKYGCVMYLGWVFGRFLDGIWMV